eukprot:Nitzschia sp. Nitz4//scaffold52_size167869//80785//82117//NITZ4_002277-RA/size167869-snap-gene-0.226-mRNA-1//-1//CDS//3329554038//5418//frame0
MGHVMIRILNFFNPTTHYRQRLWKRRTHHPHPHSALPALQTMASPIRKTLEAGILLSIAAGIIALAGFVEYKEVLPDSEDGVAVTVSFPGYAWLDRMAQHSEKVTLANGQTYTSAYDAFVYGAPLEHPCRNFNTWINSIFFSSSFAATLIEKVGVDIAHYILCYLRNFVGAMIVYYGVAGIFHYFCYVHPMSKEIFKNRVRPSWDIIWHQIKLSQTSMIIYVLLPVFDEWFVESGLTRAYFTLDDIGGWGNHVAILIFYFCCVEIGIYWMHRTLHTNKWMYKNLHLIHHYYNKAETLTPWASIAFHPVDGILQASPYVYLLPFIPCHYITHFVFLFFTEVWATYIHDSMDWNVWPMMGSKYHTVHHTHYMYNHGQVFIFCDKFWGSFREPDGPTGVVGKKL